LIDDSVEYFTRVQAGAGWARVLDAFARFVRPERGARVLDAGCGPGALARRLAHTGAHVIGCDANPNMIARAKEIARHEHADGATLRADAAYQVGALPHLPFHDREFDFVTATNVVFLQREPLAALREMARVCKPGGMVAMLNPSPHMNAAAATTYIDAQGGTGFSRESFVNWGGVAERNHRFSRDDVTQMFTASGLADLVIEDKIGGLALFAKGRKRDTDEGGSRGF